MYTRITALCVLLTAVTPAIHAQQPSPYADPRGTIFEVFKSHDLVALGEDHRRKECFDFYQALLEDPRWTKAGVRNVVVEFGNAKYQGLMDRYIAGETVPTAELKKVLQDTTQILVWDSPVYSSFFQFVRELNQKRPASQRIRVLLGDPPIEWEKVHSLADFRRYSRDAHFADLVTREVMARGQKALLISGGTHLWNDMDSQFPIEQRSAGEALRHRYPGKLFFFWSTTFPLPDGKGTGPYALIAKGSHLETTSFANFTPKVMEKRVVNGEEKWVRLDELDWPPFTQIAEGLVSYGPTETFVAPNPEIYLDQAYVQALRYRNKIWVEGGMPDRSRQIDAAVQSATKKRP